MGQPILLCFRLTIDMKTKHLPTIAKEKVPAFQQLPIRVQNALIIALQVRNSLEKFHGVGSENWITDEQMKKLNQTIRQAILDALEIIDLYSKGIVYGQTENTKAATDMYQWLVLALPDYWELPIEGQVIRSYRNAKKKHNL